MAAVVETRPGGTGFAAGGNLQGLDPEAATVEKCNRSEPTATGPTGTRRELG